MSWKPGGDPQVLAQKLVAHYGIRTGQLTYCFVCHR
jgi:hypothetical protein